MEISKKDFEKILDRGVLLEQTLDSLLVERIFNQKALKACLKEGLAKDDLNEELFKKNNALLNDIILIKKRNRRNGLCLLLGGVAAGLFLSK